MAVIPGYITDEIVVVGNHRDGIYFFFLSFHDSELSFSLGMKFSIKFAVFSIQLLDSGYGCSRSHQWYCVNSRDYPRARCFDKEGLEATSYHRYCKLGRRRGGISPLTLLFILS